VSPLVRDFWSASDSARVEVGYDSFFGYLNLRAVLSMLRRAAEPADAAALVAALGQPLTLDLGGYTLQYGPQQRHGSRFVELVVLGAEGRYLR